MAGAAAGPGAISCCPPGRIAPAVGCCPPGITCSTLPRQAPAQQALAGSAGPSTMMMDASCSQLLSPAAACCAPTHAPQASGDGARLAVSSVTPQQPAQPCAQPPPGQMLSASSLHPVSCHSTGLAQSAVPQGPCSSGSPALHLTLPLQPSASSSEAFRGGPALACSLQRQGDAQGQGQVAMQGPPGWHGTGQAAAGAAALQLGAAGGAGSADGGGGADSSNGQVIAALQEQLNFMKQLLDSQAQAAEQQKQYLELMQVQLAAVTKQPGL